MKSISIFTAVSLALVLTACGQKNNQPATAKKNQPVISTFEKPIEEPSKKQIRQEKKQARKQEKQAKSEPSPSELEVEIETVKTDTSPKTRTPLEVIQQYTKELQALDEETRGDQSRDEKIASRVQEFFDFDRLARGSLGAYWNQINASDRKKYSDLFQTLVERSYLSKSKTLVGNYDLSFDKEQIKKEEASVSCIVEKDDVDIDITYHLHRPQKDWMIYNIDFDNVNLMRNYETQFNRIIAQKGFSGLIDLMQKKVEDPIDDATM
jgi:phospholipid transport system substrate-binding protein